MTVDEPKHGDCPRSTDAAGQAFIESGGYVYLVRNEGSTAAQLNANFLARTGASVFLTPVAEPSGSNVS